MGTPAEFGDSGLGYLLIGIALGLLVGLVIGIGAYVFIKQRPQEGQHSILN